MFGFYKIGVATPKVKVSDTSYNTNEIIKLIQNGIDDKVQVLLFPELCISAYSCADLFLHSSLQNSTLNSLIKIKNSTKNFKIVVVVGASIVKNSKIYNCAVVIQNGDILGVIPKSFLPNYKEFYEKRWFSSGSDILDEHINIDGEEVAFGVDLVFSDQKSLKIGVEICEDLWAINPPSSKYAINGATLLLNLSSSNELIGKQNYRHSLVSMQSAKTYTAYAYSSSGVGESTTDTLFGGDAFVYENGSLLVKNSLFQRESSFICTYVDLEKLEYLRINESSFADEKSDICRVVNLYDLEPIDDVELNISKTPFIPNSKDKLDQRSGEIIQIAANAFAKRIEHVGSRKLVIGISGGLDSTLALITSVEALKLLNKPSSDILAYTMPGFGTTSRTLENAKELCRSLGVAIEEIDIVDIALKEFELIKHSVDDLDVTYENVQARLRTQILMNLANKHSALVVGTGDLSEIALGFSTYNGDQMSMYGVNSGIPKTLIKHLVLWYKNITDKKTAKILEDIVNTPISPELLPPSKDDITQKTEDLVGPYILHDFFLYHLQKYGASSSKILFLAKKAFKDEFSEGEIKKWLVIFLKRFFMNQFKRSAMPDGIKVGTISLSPRADLKMPSDALVKTWIDELD